jgi:uncharacterized protein (DUF433 family)
MDWTGCEMVEVIPGKVSGQPLVKNSRVQADTVVESYELGESIEDIAYDFELDQEDIRKVLVFAGFRSLAETAA